VDGPDTLQRFVFERARVRGELVRLDETWREVRRRREYPGAVRGALGELTGLLRMVGAEEVRKALADRGAIDVTCEFCGERYAVSRAEAEGALADAAGRTPQQAGA
jgi:redox-regulated HSP33 family molecular chaperone